MILFLRNIKSVKQTKNLTDSIKKIFKDKNYPILIDQEGGRVNRLSNIISFDSVSSIEPMNESNVFNLNCCTSPGSRTLKVIKRIPRPIVVHMEVRYFINRKL